MIILSHISELLAHGFNELINVIILLLNSLDVLLILVLQLINKCLDEDILLLNDLFTGLFLNINILSKLLTVFLLFKLLPSPINLNILFMRCDDFSLNFICSLLSHLFFLDSSLVLKIVGMSTDLGNDFIGSPTNLFQETLGLSNFYITVRLHFWWFSNLRLFFHTF